MIEISLCQRIHELRDKADLSLRGLVKRIGISSPFLSDIELGRRFPSEEILAKLAGALEVSPDELKQYDTRAPIADLKRLILLRNFKSPLRVALGVRCNRSSSHFVATVHVAKDLFWAETSDENRGTMKRFS